MTQEAHSCEWSHSTQSLLELHALGKLMGGQWSEFIDCWGFSCGQWQPLGESYQSERCRHPGNKRQVRCPWVRILVCVTQDFCSIVLLCWSSSGLCTSLSCIHFTFCSCHLNTFNLLVGVSEICLESPTMKNKIYFCFGSPTVSADGWILNWNELSREMTSRSICHLFLSEWFPLRKRLQCSFLKSRFIQLITYDLIRQKQWS